MSEKSPSGSARGKAPTGPKVSGARTAVSLALLAIVLVICVIEVRAALGQHLTLKSFEGKSTENTFNNVSLAEAQGMVSMFPSSPVVTTGASEDTYHYRWYSLLRPLFGKGVPELYVSADHSDPPLAVSFYTSLEGELVLPAFDPNAASAPSGGSVTPQGMGSMPMGAGGGSRKGGGKRPSLEEEPAAKEPAAAEPATAAPEDSTKTNETAVPEDDKSETPTEPK